MVYKNEQIKNCQTLEELFNLWKSKPITVQSYYDKDKKENVEVTIDHSKVFISDGAVFPEIWNDKNKGKKIAFVLKEAYGEDADWSLTDWLRKTGPGYNIWYRVVEWIYGILNTTSSSIARYSPDKISFDKSEDKPNEWLSQVAIVNIKKSGGRSTSNYDEIKAYALADKEEIIKELELLDPDIIVCGATAETLNGICGGFVGPDRCDNWYYYSDVIGDRERLFIDFYHPANRYPTLLNYYGLVNIYQQALIEKEENNA